MPADPELSHRPPGLAPGGGARLIDAAAFWTIAVLAYPIVGFMRGLRATRAQWARLRPEPDLAPVDEVPDVRT